MKPHSLFSLALVFTFAAISTQAAKLPEKLRILSCDLASISIQTPGAATNDISTEVKRLLDKADPDIVFLQRVTDWETCDRICKLRPGLRVLTCSAFPAQPGVSAAAQVAILARDKAILSWVDEISGGNDFAFALIQAGPRKLGVFSVQTSDNSAATTERVLSEARKLQQFANNRPESFLIAGAALTKAALTEAGFETVTSDVQSNPKTTPLEFWASNAGFLSRPRSISIAGIPSPVLVTDVDTANSYSSKFAYQTALLFPGESPAPIQAVLQPAIATAAAIPQPRSISITLAVAIVLGVLLVTVLLFGRKTSTALVPLSDSPLSPTDGSPLSDPVRLNLIAWLKTIFMQRLLADRRHMLATETDATRRTLAIEEKLSRLQVALQDRISAYENRISRLETELSDAAFENRALIRNQIDDLKEKVAKAKEEFVYRRN